MKWTGGNCSFCAIWKHPRRAPSAGAISRFAHQKRHQLGEPEPAAP